MDKTDLKKKLLKELNETEKKYKENKFVLDLIKADFAISIDWNKVNQHRVEHGKPKITNDANRKNYFKVHFKEEDRELLNLELAYTQLKREYELLVSE